MIEHTPRGAPGALTFEIEHVRDMLAKPRPIDWLVRGLLARDTLALVAGPPKSLKSFWADHIANSVATGRAMDGAQATRAPVLTIAGEGRDGLARRKRAWEIRHGIELSNAAVYASKTAARLCDPLAALAVQQAVERMADAAGEAPGLIVVDTLQRNLGPGDENHTGDMTRFVEHLDAHLREPFGACVLVVHHTGHAAADRPRGSTVMPASADCLFTTARVGDVVTVEPKWAKDWPAPPPLTYRMDVIELPWESADGRPETSCVLTRTDAAPATRPAPSGNAEKALSVLRGLYEKHRANLGKSGRDPASARVRLDDWREACGFDHRSTFHRAKDALTEAGLVATDMPFVDLLP